MYAVSKLASSSKTFVTRRNMSGIKNMFETPYSIPKTRQQYYSSPVTGMFVKLHSFPIFIYMHIVLPIESNYYN